MASVSKRGEKWTVRYLDGGGVHRQKTFDKKRDADLYRSKVEIDLSRKVHSALAGKMTVAQAGDSFMRHMDERAKDGRIGLTHLRRIEYLIRLHVSPYLSAYRLEQVTLPVLEEWFLKMRKARNLSARSARHAAQSLKMIFDHAIKREWTFRNPANELLRETRGGRTDEVATFSIEQIRQLLVTVNLPMYKGRTPDAAVRTQCAVHLATFCGLRLGEILGLRQINVDFGAGLIRVRNSLSRHDGLKGPKSKAGVRDVAMPAHVAMLLRNWIDEFQVADREANPSGLLFTYRTGKPMDANSFRNGSWGPLLVRAGLATDYKKPPFHFHALRHFAASWMIDNGWSLPEVAGALGHSKVDMTMSVYAHALRNRAANADQMEALSSRLLDRDDAIAAQPERMARAHVAQIEANAL